jgi:valyl-tRNA synthetase
MDKWILSRLADTVSLCNHGLKTYDLVAATTALFNFWLYELCDYYIEYLKPTFYASKREQHEQQRWVIE